MHIERRDRAGHRKKHFCHHEFRLDELGSGIGVGPVDLTNEGHAMSAHTYKLLELVGSSPIGVDDAIRNAIEKASQSVRHLEWFEVVETRGHIQDGKVAHFQVTLKIGFRIDDAS